MICDSLYHRVESFGQTQEHVGVFTSPHDSVLGCGVGFSKVRNCLRPRSSGEPGDRTCTLSARSTLPSLHVRGRLAFGCEAQGLGRAKRKRAHFGADAGVRPRGPAGRAVQQAH